ncbi:MAG TPA: ElyC/SanA/YdcF family protein [Steroidobacteraceae bacterium]|nr:ElyC/SanA/YdcF family protein [Steroidobacteraceae bacterium]
MLDLLRLLVTPSALGAALFVLGILVLMLPATRRLARPLLLGSGAVLFVFSFGPVATLLLSPLEYAYPAMTDPERHGRVRTIVLLTAYASDDPHMPLSSRMNASSAFRVLEAASLARRCPECRIIVSGNAIAADAMIAQLEAMGIAGSRLSRETASQNTAASAENLAPIIGSEEIFLVTSAGHMRRSLAVFARHGLRAIPVPADHQLPSSVARAEWTVSPFNLNASDLALHEYAGYTWYRLTGRI